MAPRGFLLKNWRGVPVTVIWAFPRLDMPHSQNPRDMGIPSHITLAIWVSGDAHACYCDTYTHPIF